MAKETTLDFDIEDFKKWSSEQTKNAKVSYEEITTIINDIDGGGYDIDDLVEQKALLRYMLSVEDHISFLIKKMERFRNQLYKNNIVSQELYQFLNDMEQKELVDDYHLTAMFENKMLKITFPDLLPHRIRNDNIPYVKALQNLLNDMKKNHNEEIAEISTSERAVMVIKHSYKNSAMIRDNDNTELKKVIDLFQIAGIIPTDRGDYLMHFHFADNKKSDNSHTTIYLMSLETFQKEMCSFL